MQGQARWYLAVRFKSLQRLYGSQPAYVCTPTVPATWPRGMCTLQGTRPRRPDTGWLSRQIIHPLATLLSHVRLSCTLRQTCTTLTYWTQHPLTTFTILSLIPCMHSLPAPGSARANFYPAPGTLLSRPNTLNTSLLTSTPSRARGVQAAPSA